MTALSVNINKIATIRNTRGGDIPNLTNAAKKIESYGADGITIHPRPDERHIRYQDARDLKSVVKTELNIEGNPTSRFLELIEEVKPAQVTLVPDKPGALTSNAGWDTVANKDFLEDVVRKCKSWGCRVSIFVDPDISMVEGADKVGTDRIELYTESYALGYFSDREQSIRPFVAAAKAAHDLGLEVNAGHDLSLDNLKYFAEHVPHLAEVSIGHALISDALYLGLENTVNMYKSKLQ